MGGEEAAADLSQFLYESVEVGSEDMFGTLLAEVDERRAGVRLYPRILIIVQH